MMIQNLHDPDFVGAFHGLRKFIVVDQDQLAVGPLEEITLGQDPDEHSGVIENRKNKGGRARSLLPHMFEQSVRSKSQVFRFQHAPDPLLERYAAGHELGADVWHVAGDADPEDEPGA